MEKFDILDGIIGGITAIVLVGLIWGNPSPELAVTLTNNGVQV